MSRVLWICSNFTRVVLAVSLSRSRGEVLKSSDLDVRSRLLMEREGHCDLSVVELFALIYVLELDDFEFGGVDCEDVVEKTMMIHNFMRGQKMR